MCSTTAGAIADPEALERSGPAWLDAAVPATAASALRVQGAWSLDAPPRRFDGEDWWWHTRVSAAPCEPAEQLALRFAGLATVAQVWLDGAPLLASDNMFVAHRVPVSLGSDSELVIRFAGLDALLDERRPRPRWRAPMVEHQQLRWFRTTLLGRTPGWSPPAAAIGPWRAIELERARAVRVEDVSLAAYLEGDTGVVRVACDVVPLGDPIAEVTLVVNRDGQTVQERLRCDGGRHYAGALRVDDVARWWPHTHGKPSLYQARLVVHTVAGTTLEADLGAIGFRTIELHRDAGDFRIRVNGVSVFCRGACWTPLDPVALHSGRNDLDAALGQVCDAGLNMLRVGGTMVYESDDFLDLADERGVLLWQDFMFANMDYPTDDPVLSASIETEVVQQLQRLQARPSLALLCGNSEGEQQAAMWGAPRTLWQPTAFHETLPALVRQHCPDVPYWPSSAHGGSFPHAPDSGSSSYYGVGAYLRPLEDARHSRLRFASECLAFANVPGDRSMDAMPGGRSARVHHPGYKERTPRDLGAGWDFDDVRDHYLALLFDVDPLALRYADHARYLELSRVVTGEVMSAAFGEWRRTESGCRGALVWFLRDLWPGSGWGVVGADGEPKAAYYYMRRALQPVAVHIADEGCSGLCVHIANDRAEAVRGRLSLSLVRGGDILVGSADTAVDVAGRSIAAVPVMDLFEGFLDLSYAYRFGPPSADLVIATLTGDNGNELARAFHFPVGRPSTRELDVGITAEAISAGDGDLDLTVRTRRFAQSVAIDAGGFRPDDNYFHMGPGTCATVRLSRIAGAKVRRGTVKPLNAEATAKITTP